jgi:hypothetical protein
MTRENMRIELSGFTCQAMLSTNLKCGFVRKLLKKSLRLEKEVWLYGKSCRIKDSVKIVKNEMTRNCVARLKPVKEEEKIRLRYGKNSFWKVIDVNAPMDAVVEKVFKEMKWDHRLVVGFYDGKAVDIDKSYKEQGSRKLKIYWNNGAGLDKKVTKKIETRVFYKGEMIQEMIKVHRCWKAGKLREEVARLFGIGRDRVICKRQGADDDYYGYEKIDDVWNDGKMDVILDVANGNSDTWRTKDRIRNEVERISDDD